MELQTIIDENDIEISGKPRDKILPTDIFRISSVWILDTQGNILLGKRSSIKKNDPNKLTTLVNGTVSQGESYFETAIRETAEEIGIESTDITELKKIRVSRPDHDFFVTYFKLVIDHNTKLDIDSNEISQTVWISKKQIKEDINQNPDKYVPMFNEILNNILPLI